MTIDHKQSHWSMLGLATALLISSWLGNAQPVLAADEAAFLKSGGGLTVYFGIVPAEIVKGPATHSNEQPMHGHTPRGAHEFHIIAALFDAVTGARVSDANVTAQVSGLGLSGAKETLEAMQIEGTMTYGAFFDLPGADLYTVKLHVDRPAPARSVDLEFKYDHRQ